MLILHRVFVVINEKKMQNLSLFLMDRHVFLAAPGSSTSSSELNQNQPESEVVLHLFLKFTRANDLVRFMKSFCTCNYVDNTSKNIWQRKNWINDLGMS
jgi:hypothetical protein